MKRILLSLVLVTGLIAPASAGEFLNLAHGILATRRPATPVTPKPGPGPAPAPVSDICDNCNGVGKVGDGRTMLTCPVCNGSGKKTKAEPVVVVPEEPAVVVPEEPAVEPAPQPVAPSLPSYPLRRSWWSGCPDWRHLTTGQHRGLFDTTWLQTLSYEEVQSLHSDHHEGRTKWEFVVRPQLQPTAPVAAPAVRSGCPEGGCPPTSRRMSIRGRWLNN